MEIDWQRLPDSGYRWEVVSGLMQDHAKVILQYCTIRLGEGLGEEVTQEAFVAAWQQLPRYRPEAPLSTWTYRKFKSLFRPGPSAARSHWRLRAAMAATSAPSGCGRQPRATRPSAA